MKRAIFPGTFDPFTIGHYSVVRRALGLFDEIIIAIGTNQSKTAMFPLAERIKIIQQAFASEPRVSIETYDCLTT
ncbi:MAG: adenylyltransferase/cytidyltransferase family protein, partial [Paludibacter sp.]|nr:adenylyltransferase/cytidyltransferase family protein [Paludibacter sp.]